MKNRHLIITAKIFSELFAPHYFPLVCMMVLMGFSYMRSFPLDYKILILAIVYLLTIALPTRFIKLYQKWATVPEQQKSKRKLRIVPYMISIACYFACFKVMSVFIVPHFVISVVVTAIFVQLICLFINNWHRISTHCAAAGALNGALLAFSFIFHFNPTWWLCVTLILAGCVGSSRLILRRHSPMEVNLGLVTGFLTGFLGILVL